MNPEIGAVLAGGRDWAVVQGDSLEMLPTLPPACVEAVITDPPYSSGGMFRADRANFTTDEKYTVHQHQGKRPSFFGDNMDQRSWRNWCRLWMVEAGRVAREGGYLVCFTDWRQLPSLTDVIQHARWVWRGLLAWDKTEAAKGPHPGYFAYQCEFLAWATKGPCFHKPTLHDGGQGRMPGCFRQAVAAADKHHQTGKPTSVMQWLAMCCPPGGVVLDPFAGSGTTGVACLKSNRRFIGIELSEEYCAVARKRLQTAEREQKEMLFPARERPTQRTFEDVEPEEDEG